MRKPRRFARAAAAAVAVTTIATVLPAGADELTTGPVVAQFVPPLDKVANFVAPDPIPVNGFGVPELAPVAAALRDYVKQRCAGAATVGVSYQGTVLAEWGVGREHGRAASPILDPACGNDVTDPFDPGSPVADEFTPMRIGSVSKTISAAVMRWALKTKYEELTGQVLTDDALEAMPLLGDDFPGGLIPEDLRALLAGEVRGTAGDHRVRHARRRRRSPLAGHHRRPLARAPRRLAALRARHRDEDDSGTAGAARPRHSRRVLRAERQRARSSRRQHARRRRAQRARKAPIPAPCTSSSPRRWSRC